MNFAGKTGRNVHGSELKRGREVGVRVYDADLGVGIVDELSDGGNAVWIFFSGTAPRWLPTDSASTEFTLLESEVRFPAVESVVTGHRG